LDQRAAPRRPVAAGNHDLAVDQERLRLETSSGFDNHREAVGPVIAIAREAANANRASATSQNSALYARCCSVTFQYWPG
jgi:hypothetical protein